MKLSKAGARICSFEEQKFWNVANTQLQVSRKREERDGPSTHVRTYTLGITQDMLSTESREAPAPWSLEKGISKSGNHANTERPLLVSP